MEHRDRGAILTVIGGLLLLVGVGCAILGPVEMYCFYLFAEGGPFHYEGFGFGSFMFANLTCQIAGYYLIAVLAVPLGYGHWKRRRWARTLSEALLWAWLVVGVPLTILFLLVLLSSKDLTPAVALGVSICLALTYPIVPLLLIRFYRGRNVQLTFESRDPKAYWTERLPMPVLVVSGLFIFYALLLHVPILFNGMFPLFGTWLTGLQGIVALTIAILVLLFITWGFVRQKAWAWWGSLIYFIALPVSAVATLARSSYLELLALMRFPPFEVEILQGIPLQGIHLVAFFGLPLILTLGAILVSKRCFGGERQAAPEAKPQPAVEGDPETTEALS